MGIKVSQIPVPKFVEIAIFPIVFEKKSHAERMRQIVLQAFSRHKNQN